MKTSRLDSFLSDSFTNTHAVTGGSKHTPDPCDPNPPANGKAKGNNGIGQEKRGILDGPPPGLAKQPRQDFNDVEGNRHGVEV